MSKPTKPNPVCSVIIPSYNCLNYLKQALASVEEQRVDNLEIIVVDDNSSDGTWQWLQQYQHSHPHLRSIKLSGNGPAYARNIAIKQANAPLIAFLDADDIWLEGKLQRQIDYHQQHPELSFSFTDYRHVSEQGEDRGTCFEFWPSYHHLGQQKKSYQFQINAAAKLFAENVVGTSTVLASKEALLSCFSFDEHLPSAEDWDLWLKLALTGPVAVGSYCDCEYLMRDGSESSKSQQRLNAMHIIYQRYASRISGQSTAALTQAKARIATAEAELFNERKQRMSAMMMRLKALSLSPDKRRFIETLADARNLLLLK
ncbi:glycosyltransferase family 2 protein [Agarivorans sp. 1_MG-2023]|uniref:glycosyltransferase family 2 protein n=1 Tax=Agarivorans sp. 1_MG-2023 TaxID=3062634 RepID=UPI0026E42B09|nr:glycosyltransferase family 2 protein [Agarivorans sp. 1_MG-2023]MDO6761921.1 glycosyltransferase family 2 protein [Agarivorans sp. 1_MG-2023]